MRRLTILRGVALRRLFSTFAGGGPGIGLLLLRLVVGITLIIHGTVAFQTGEPIRETTLQLLALGDGALLIAGLWTPLAGTALVILGLWGALLHENPYADVLLATIGTALTLLGPGAWSVDARLFGWKRIDIER